jgi:hypothetical protein
MFSRLKELKESKKQIITTLQIFLTDASFNLDEEVRLKIQTLKNDLEIDVKESESLFICKTYSLIENYKILLQKPVTQKENNSFISTFTKQEIINKYVNNVIDLQNQHLFNAFSANNSRVFTCSICNNTNSETFEIDEFNRTTCLMCSTQHYSIEKGITHKDYTRVNIVNKFIYNRVIHFHDCIKQYQGTQNCKIPTDVIDNLLKKFHSHHLILEGDNKYSKINKYIILTFLKDLNYKTQYENANLIYFLITKKKIDDISYLEDQIVEDFKELTILYDEIYNKNNKNHKRKNFMNVQYLLFQLLKRHNHSCKIENFSIIKTIDRKIFHDTVCKLLFSKLQWKFTPVF